MGMLSLGLAAAVDSEGDGDVRPGVAGTSVAPALEGSVPESPLSTGEIILKGELARLLISRSSSCCNERGPGAAAAAPAVTDAESPAVSRAPSAS